jgi:hypothetical protein
LHFLWTFGRTYCAFFTLPLEKFQSSPLHWAQLFSLYLSAYELKFLGADVDTHLTETLTRKETSRSTAPTGLYELTKELVELLSTNPTTS